MTVYYGVGYYGLDGTSASNAAPSAHYLKHNYGYADGVYWINLPTVGPTQVYCLMDDKWDGGGWMMMMKATTGNTFKYSANYWTTNNTLNSTDNTRNNADAKFNTMNYFPSRDLLAIWPDISTTGGSLSGTGYWTWMQKNFYGGSRIVPITFFNTVSNYFIQDAKTFNGWSNGVFSSQTDVRFYGFNYSNTPGWAKTRWGFGWNENGGGLWPNGDMNSDDVWGGIGLNTTNWGGDTGISAGDAISCCQDTTGINRQARVEVYVR